MSVSKALLIGSLCLPAIVTGAAIAAPTNDNAISQINGEIGAEYNRTEYNGSSDRYDNYNGNGALNIPLGPWFGASLRAMAGQGEYTVTNSDFDYYDLSALLMTRNPNLGMLALGGGRTTFNFTRESNEDYVQGIAAGYIGPVTLAATRTRTELDPSGRSNDWIADAVWYVTPNFLLDASAGFMAERDNYGLEFEHQIGHSGLSWGLGYGRDTNIDANSYNAMVAYRIAQPKSLIDRYRHDLVDAR